MLGYLIDYALVLGAAIVLYGAFILLQGALLGLTSVSEDLTVGAMGGSCCVALVVFPLATLAVRVYNRVYPVSTRGYSIGQGLTWLKVVTAMGECLTVGNAVVRLFAQIGISMFPFGIAVDLLWPLIDERRQTLHDKAVSSFVVYRRS